MASIGELFIELGIKADTQTINKVNAGFKNLRKNLLLTAGAFTGAVIGLDRFVTSALNGVVSLQNLNAQTGLSIEKLQQFQQAGQLSNLALSADQIAQSIGNVQKNLANIRIGQGNIAPFQLLGIDVAGANAFDVIEQLRESIKGIDPAIATNLISQLGLTPDFINILKLSRKEFELLGENTFLNPKQRADIDRVGTSIKALTLRFKALKDQAVAKIAPQLNELIQNFFKWLKDNGDKVVKVITSIVRGFISFTRAIGNAFDLSARFLENIVGMENGVKLLATAFALLSLSLSPFLIGLAAIILLLDDIAVFRRGGDSAIGALVEAFEGLPDIAKLLGGGAGLLVLASSLGAVTKSIIAMTGPALALAGPLVAIVGALTFLANAPQIGEKLGKIIDQTETGQSIGDALLNFKDALQSGSGLVPSFVVGASSFVGGQRPNITTTNNINVTGFGDNSKVASETGKVVTKSQEEIIRIFTGQGNGLK